MLALILDSVNTLMWMQTEDGVKGKNQPPSIYQRLTGQEKEEEKEYNTYLSGADFDAARAKILSKILGEEG